MASIGKCPRPFLLIVQRFRSRHCLRGQVRVGLCMEPYVCSSSPFWFWFLKGLNEASVADYAGKDCLTPTTCTDVGASLALLRRLMITEILYLLRQIFLLVLPPFRSTDLFGGAGTGARGLRLSAVLIWARATTSTGMPRRHTPSPRLAISAAAGQRWWRACQFSAPSLRRLEFFLTISPASVRRAQHLPTLQVVTAIGTLETSTEAGVSFRMRTATSSPQASST